MVLAALVAFLLNLALLRGEDELVLIAVARNDIPAGASVSSGMIELVESIDTPVLATMVSSTEVESVYGMIAAVSVPQGDPILLSSLRAAAAPGERRAFSIPVDRSRAVGGVLRSGDRVDVIATIGGESVYVVAGVEVLSVPTESSGGLVAASSGYHIVVAVDDAEALALAQAIDGAKIHVVRSTGAPAPTTTTTTTMAPLSEVLPVESEMEE